MENITKSIVYGNSYQNRYGRFLPICSSISDRASIQCILDYLHDTPHFKKYNRVAYAYRVEEAPVVFITEKKNVENQHYQGSHSDQTIEGSGDKLLHLLQKFNIRNVFISIMIQQFNPLLPFETTNYRAIVENCRVLLDQLYKKVVAIQDQAQMRSFNDLLLHNTQTTKLKKCNISENIDMPTKSTKKIITKQRPNHIYTNGKPQFLNTQSGKGTDAASLIYQIKFLWERCKLMKEQFQNLIVSLDQKEIEQIRYYAMYDKNAIMNQVIKLLTIYVGVDRNFLMNEYNFQELKLIKMQNLDEKKLKNLDDFVKSNKKLSVDTVMKINRPIGVVFSIIEIKIRFSKTLKRISELMEKSEFSQKDLQEMQKMKNKTEGSTGNKTKIVLQNKQKSIASSVSEKKIYKF